MRPVSATAIWQRFLLKSITQDPESNYPGLLHHMCSLCNWLVSEKKSVATIFDITHKALQYTYKQ